MLPTLLLHTVRHLKPVQLYGRIWRRVYNPSPDLRPAPPLRRVTGELIPACSRPQTLVGPRQFRLLHREYSIDTAEDWNNPEVPRLWTYNLHYFDFLRAGTEAPTVHAWIHRWIHENPPRSGAGWEPYPIACRLVNWVKWAVTAGDFDSVERDSLAVQARYLARRLETHLLANHLLVNLKGLYFAGAFLTGDEAESWRKTAATGLVRELGRQILRDGAHFELSPMYHALTTEDALDVMALQRAYANSLAQPFDQRLGLVIGGRIDSMIKWLLAMTHPDGEIALFNDSAFGVAPSPKCILEYAARLGLANLPRLDTTTHLRESGYVRVVYGDSVAFLDVGEIGASYQPAHAHADCLSFEWSLFGERLLVDPGTSTYELSAVRAQQRGTQAHNTIAVAAQDSSEVWGAFRVARRAAPLDVKVDASEGGVRVSGAHDGYAQHAGPLHRRTWIFERRTLRIEDTLEGCFKPSVSNLCFHPDASLEQVGEQSVDIHLHGIRVRFRCEGGRVELGDAMYAPEFGRELPTRCIRVALIGKTLRQTFDW